jgi:hypothetical protein
MMSEANTKNPQGQRRHVFSIVERQGKSYWIKIGAAFVNRDGSETVLLDAWPIGGKIQIRTVPAKSPVRSESSAE